MALKTKGAPAQAEREAAKAERAAYQERYEQYELREPKGPSEFDVFLKALSDDLAPWAHVLWQMQCDHKWETVLNGPNGEKRTVMCERCNKMLSWGGSDAKTRFNEWYSYCPPGFDMFDWEELYVRDKTMWPIIFEEVLFEMEPQIGGTHEQS